MIFDLVISGGKIVTADRSFHADLGITNGKIASIDHNLTGNQLIDATKCLVISGGVDPHVHLEMPTPAATSSDDWYSGTRAAACGGTTTVIDFVEPEPNESLLAALEKRRAQAEAKTNIDFSLHMTISRTDQATLDEISRVVEAGVTSFKCYTTYAMRLDDEQIRTALEAVGHSGGLTIVHAENHAIIEYFRKEFIREGKVAPRYHPLSRPDYTEGEAIERVLNIAESIHAPVYIVHVSTRRGAEAIERAQGREQKALGETCPQYLVLTEQEYSRSGFEGAKFICSPPLRTTEDQNSLWKALQTGVLQAIGTDHCPFFYNGMKDLGRTTDNLPDFTEIPGGLPGIEARLALLYTFGVKAGKLTENQWVSLCSTGPARIFGLYPQKGCLNVGSDADIVIFDPEKEITLSHSSLHEHVDYTPYEGIKLTGYPIMTILGGRVIAKNGEFIGKSRGKFVARKPYQNHSHPKNI